MMKSIVSAVLGLLGGTVIASPNIPTSISWSGYDWHIRTGNSQEPGPNNWAAQNVWVDSDGYLNLRISKINGKVYCASIATNHAMKDGTYTWVVEGPLTGFDENVVLGLFQYPQNQRTNGLNEIDIEIAQWGIPTLKRMKYTVWPTILGPERFFESAYDVFPAKEYVYFYHRNSGTVSFDNRWTSDKATSEPLLVMMNLWLFRGEQSYTRDYIVRIKSFSFVESK